MGRVDPESGGNERRMKIDLSGDSDEKALVVFEALASAVRLKMLRLLAERPMNVRELAEATGLSSAIMTLHVRKLERAGLVRTELLPGRNGVQKRCSLAVARLETVFPTARTAEKEFHEVEISVGHYVDFRIEPTCGLATTEKVIGEFDEPVYFSHPERVNAKILWFGKGYVEYRVPNFLLASQQPVELEISLELSSEAPRTNPDWPSDIAFYLNGVRLGVWTSPGDFGDRRGRYTPDWWPPAINQYGLLKRLKITKNGTFVDGNPMSSVTIDDVSIRNRHWSFRIAVEDDAEHIGGATLFGRGFGNYDQDIVFRLFYVKTSPGPFPQTTPDTDRG